MNIQLLPNGMIEIGVVPRYAAKRDPFGPKELNRWMGGDDPVTIISAARGTSGRDDKRRMQMLMRDLRELGVKDRDVKSMRGQWWSDQDNRMRPEPSIAVRGMPFDEAMNLAKRYNQDAFIYKDPSGVLAMYEGYRDTDEGGLTATVPSTEGTPLFGPDAVKVQPRKPKEQRRGPPGEPPEELFTGTRSNTFEFAYDWDEPRREIQLDTATPLTREQVSEHFQPTPEDEPLRRPEPEKERQTVPVVASNHVGNLAAQEGDRRRRADGRQAQRQVELIDEEDESEIPETPLRERRRPPSVEELPTESPPEREHGFAVTDLQPDGGYQNIKWLMTLAKPEEVDYWANWYPIANRESKRLAEDMGVPLDVAAGVIAVLSPGVRWEENIALAEDVILQQDELRQKLAEMYDERGRLKPFEERSTLGLAAKHPEFVRKALAILEANDPMVGQPRGVKGPKVEVFYDSMVDPQGTSRDIVLDGHAINLWRGAKDQPITGTTITKPQREQISEDYRRVADEYGLSPQEVQAITWSLWRAMKKQPQRPGTRMNLMAQLESLDPEAVALMAELNGLTVEQVMKMMHGTTKTAAIPAAILAAVRWLAANPQVVMTLIEMYPEVKELFSREAARMTFIDDTQRKGEVEIAEAKPGDSVRFTSEFQKPGWPRVDAGEVGRVRAVSPEADSLDIDVVGSMPREGGFEVQQYSVTVPSNTVALLLNSDDPRAA